LPGNSLTNRQEELPSTLDDIEIFLLKKEAIWRERRIREHEEFVELIRVGRALAAGIRTVLIVLEKFESLQLNNLAILQNNMANSDTVRFLANGLKRDIEQDRKLAGDNPKDDLDK
jgi:hypothetical protein